MFDQLYKSETAELMADGRPEEQAKEEAPCIVETREMLIKWEANDPEVRQLWRTMNGWVYAGFDETYKTLGVDFDKIYYESDTYTIGRDEVLRGVKEGIFQQESDGSVWANLEKEGLDKRSCSARTVLPCTSPRISGQLSYATAIIPSII